MFELFDNSLEKIQFQELKRREFLESKDLLKSLSKSSSPKN